VSIAPGWRAEEIREFVYEFERQPHGTKRAWLVQQGVSTDRLRRWRETVFDGDLDRCLIPREGTGMTPAKKRRHVAKANASRDAEVERLRARVTELESANDALGKAIGLLHRLNEQEPDAAPKSNGRSSSSPPKTNS
jgi:hypothetical protein